MNISVISRIAQQFSIAEIKHIDLCSGGIINESYLIHDVLDNKYIMQKMHHVFQESVMTDTVTVSDYLRSQSVSTIKFVPTRNGCQYVIEKNVLRSEIWRMMEYIPGLCLDGRATCEQTFSAAATLGLFHATLSSFSYTFKHKISNFHDTKQIMKKLLYCAENNSLSVFAPVVKNADFSATDYCAIRGELAKQIYESYIRLSPKIHGSPSRIIHGDLKISNVRFDSTGRFAHTLLDLDTLGHGFIATDVGDMVRSWCSTSSEDDSNPMFDMNIFESLLRGYISMAKSFLTKNEFLAISRGVADMILEVAARFVIDSFEQNYFQINNDRYSSRIEQGCTRGALQFSYYQNFLAHQDDADLLVLELSRDLR